MHRCIISGRPDILFIEPGFSLRKARAVNVRARARYQTFALRRPRDVTVHRYATFVHGEQKSSATTSAVDAAVPRPAGTAFLWFAIERTKTRQGRARDETVSRAAEANRESEFLP